MNSCVTRPAMSLRWNIAATATAEANLAKLAFISMLMQRIGSSSTQNVSTPSPFCLSVNL